MEMDGSRSCQSSLLNFSIFNGYGIVCHFLIMAVLVRACSSTAGVAGVRGLTASAPAAVLGAIAPHSWNPLFEQAERAKRTFASSSTTRLLGPIVLPHHPSTTAATRTHHPRPHPSTGRSTNSIATRSFSSYCGPEETYAKLVSSGKITDDPNQRVISAKLEALSVLVKDYTPAPDPGPSNGGNGNGGGGGGGGGAGFLRQHSRLPTTNVCCVFCSGPPPRRGRKIVLGGGAGGPHDLENVACRASVCGGRGGSSRDHV